MDKMETMTTNTTDSIRNMKVGDELEFPIAKADTIRTIVWTRLLPERSNGMRWTTIVDKEHATITLRRIE
jgi:hypothetical protein